MKNVSASSPSSVAAIEWTRPGARMFSSQRRPPAFVTAGVADHQGRSGRHSALGRPVRRVERGDLEAGDVLAHRSRHDGLADIGHRAVFQHVFLDVVVHRDALGRIRLHHRLVGEVVDPLILPRRTPGWILRQLRLRPVVRIDGVARDHAVGIGIAGAPADQQHIEVAGTRAGEQVGVRHLLQVQLDPDLRRIRRDRLRQLRGEIVRRQDELLLEPVRIPRLGNQLLGLIQIELERLPLLLVERAERRQRHQARARGFPWYSRIECANPS